MQGSIAGFFRFDSRNSFRPRKHHDFEFVSTVEKDSTTPNSYDYWFGPEDTNYVAYIREDGSWDLENDETAVRLSFGKNSASLKWALKELFPNK